MSLTASAGIFYGAPERTEELLLNGFRVGQAVIYGGFVKGCQPAVVRHNEGFGPLCPALAATSHAQEADVVVALLITELFDVWQLRSDPCTNTIAGDWLVRCCTVREGSRVPKTGLVRRAEGEDLDNSTSMIRNGENSAGQSPSPDV